jgi:hypothetical protein
LLLAAVNVAYVVAFGISALIANFDNKSGGYFDIPNRTVDILFLYHLELRFTSDYI